MLRRFLRAALPTGVREWLRWRAGRPTPQMAPRGELRPDWAAAASRGENEVESDRSLRRSRFVASFVAAVTLPRSDVALLDVGCGGGRLHRRLDEFEVLDRIRYTGLDQGDVAAAARAAIPADVVEGSAERLPFADDSFDVVVAMNVLETLPAFQTALGELLRVASWLVVVAGHGSTKGREEVGHINAPGVGWWRVSMWRPADLHRFALSHGAAFAWSLNDITRDDPGLLNVSVLLKA